MFTTVAKKDSCFSTFLCNIWIIMQKKGYELITILKPIRLFIVIFRHPINFSTIRNIETSQVTIDYINNESNNWDIYKCTKRLVAFNASMI
jgi:hypothetical protein